MTKPHYGGRPKADPRATRAWSRHRPKAVRPLAAHLGISQPAVSKWAQVPGPRLEDVATFLGVTPVDLRPDLFPPPWADLSKPSRSNTQGKT